jgi:hypothetical protein
VVVLLVLLMAQPVQQGRQVVTAKWVKAAAAVQVRRLVPVEPAAVVVYQAVQAVAAVAVLLVILVVLVQEGR